MKRLFAISVLCVLCVAEAAAQEFVTINPDTRAAAMGGASVAITADAWSAADNAAAPLFSKSMVQAQVSFTPWQMAVSDGYYLLSLGGYVRMGDKHALSLSARRYIEPKLDAGDFPFVPKDENNKPLPLELSRPGGMMINLGYGLKLLDKLSASVTAGYAQAADGIGGRKNALTFDISLYSSVPLRSLCDGAALNIGAKVSNIGISLSPTKASIPALFKAGMALYMPFSDSQALECTADAGYQFYRLKYLRSFVANAGLEYTFMKTAMLRVGYMYRNYGCFTVGAGVRFKHIRIDASYWAGSNICPWRNTFSVGAGVEF